MDELGHYEAALAAIVVAIITGIFSWVIARRKDSTDSQREIREGFIGLLTEMRRERDQDAKDLALFREAVGVLQRKVASLASHIVRLEKYLEAHGLGKDAPRLDLMGMPEVEDDG